MRSLFFKQRMIQQEMIDRGLYSGFLPDDAKVPCDSPKMMSYHIQHLVSEIGEVLEADKRWKSHRNEKYDRPAKIKEIADCFIVLFNLCIFSGIGFDEIAVEIHNKQNEVLNRMKN